MFDTALCGVVMYNYIKVRDVKASQITAETLPDRINKVSQNIMKQACPQIGAMNNEFISLVRNPIASYKEFQGEKEPLDLPSYNVEAITVCLCV